MTITLVLLVLLALPTTVVLLVVRGRHGAAVARPLRRGACMLTWLVAPALTPWAGP